ncbi:hypothetical protein [Roseovarius dicentrarchi]|uniref:hypothetical protein n=1 Tax=Roseovarius dicentrarchi TaxID=2250573 RepID=UPI000DE873C9|nr:hypothetical protein [Roseovarius dicentrarchi]
MHIKPLVADTALIFAASPIWADTAAPLTYEQFEAAVPHSDLETCPEALAQDNVFCRATLRHEEIHVFAFSEDGDQVFVGFKTYPADGLGALLK